VLGGLAGHLAAIRAGRAGGIRRAGPAPLDLLVALLRLEIDRVLRAGHRPLLVGQELALGVALAAGHRRGAQRAPPGHELEPAGRALAHRVAPAGDEEVAARPGQRVHLLRPQADAALHHGRRVRVDVAALAQPALAVAERRIAADQGRDVVRLDADLAERLRGILEGHRAVAGHHRADPDRRPVHR